MELLLAARSAARARGMRTLLEAQGYTVVGCASTLPDALALSAQVLPACVVCETVLPGGDGAALLHGLRKNENLPFVPRFVLLGGGFSFLPVEGGGCIHCDAPQTLPAVLKSAKDAVPALREPWQRALRELLPALGIAPHTLGYAQLLACVALCCVDPWRMQDLRGSVYPLVGQGFACSGACVERNIRYSIENAWRYGCMERQERFFGQTILSDKGKPTNRAFLAELAHRLRRGAVSPANGLSFCENTAIY